VAWLRLALDGSLPRPKSRGTPTPGRDWNHQVSHKIPCKIRFSKSLDTKIRETKDLGARRIGLCRPSRPRPSLRMGWGVDKVGCHSGLWKFFRRRLRTAAVPPFRKGRERMGHPRVRGRTRVAVSNQSQNLFALGCIARTFRKPRKVRQPQLWRCQLWKSNMGQPPDFSRAYPIQQFFDFSFGGFEADLADGHLRPADRIANSLLQLLSVGFALRVAKFFQSAA
jgi:hypothetical protein